MTFADAPETKLKLLNAALSVIRTKGYAAMRVEDICTAAGVTKGGFFHYFPSKEDLAVTAAHYWSEMTGGFFAAQTYRRFPDPLERVLGYIDFRKAILKGSVPEFTCLVGTMVQETYDSNPAIRAACDASISAHAATVAEDIAAAKELYAPHADWTPESLGLHTQAVLQGAFILAKCKGGPEVAAQSVDHLRRYVELLFNRDSQGRTRDDHCHP